MGEEIVEKSTGDKSPRTDRGRKTLRKLLDAATLEFGENGFHEASISGITQRAGVALGTFYTYFDSKDAIFQALVLDMSQLVKTYVAPAVTKTDDALTIERNALKLFLQFATDHKEVYRIIDEAEFVDPASFREHYETTAKRIFERLKNGVDKGELRDDLTEAHAWAIMGMNVFLGMRYSIWSESEDLSCKDIAELANGVLAKGISKL